MYLLRQAIFLPRTLRQELLIASLGIRQESQSSGELSDGWLSLFGSFFYGPDKGGQQSVYNIDSDAEAQIYPYIIGH